MRTGAALAALSSAAFGNCTFGARPYLPDSHHMPTPVALQARAAIVVNPTKVSELPSLTQRVNAAFERAGWGEPLWYETSATQPGFEQASTAVARGVSVVVACGGDGTVRECAKAVCNTPVALGLLPAGTGNLFARAMGIPLDVDRALAIVIDGERKRVDVGNANGTTFLVIAGMGFDAQMVGDASEGLKARIGIAAYVWTALRRLLEKPMHVEVTIDGSMTVARHARCVLVGKVGRLPGGLQLMDVEPDDGRLAVAIITARGLGHWLRIAWAVITRRDRLPRIETHRAVNVLIRASRPQRCEIDGDEVDSGRTIDARVVPGALLLCVSTR